MRGFLFVLFLVPVFVFSQKTAIVKGFVTSKQYEALEDVTVNFEDTGTTTKKNGYYEIRIPLNKTVTLTFRSVGYSELRKEFKANRVSVIRFSPTMISKTEILETVTVKSSEKDVQGELNIDAKLATRIPSANQSVTTVLMTLPGVSNNNELSTQYNVRGGNFDENLVYVNGIEIYRPFLIRSGQQEGLNFVNTNMVQNISFSAGGFQAKYGDRLSSVLNIDYRKPKEFGLAIDGSLLGGSITIEDALINNKLSIIVGMRYRDNSLFVNRKQIQTNFTPRFTDMQGYLSYKHDERWTFNFLGNFSLNNYDYQPVTRRTRFGTVGNPLELIVFYNGKERDQYLTMFGALSTEYQVNDNLKLTANISAYNTQEEEYFDIIASYNLGEVDTNVGSQTFGEVTFAEGIGSQLNHSRNDLDALITNIQIRGTHKKDRGQIDFGIKYQNEDIRDRIREYEVIDSLGFSIRPPETQFINDQPYNPFISPITPFQSIRTENELTNNRIMGFVQYSKRNFWGDHKIWWNVGVRGQSWSVKASGVSAVGQLILSPRAQFSIKPDWEKDILFKISGGLYAQPPFYKELRGLGGDVVPSVKAQKSVHLVTGMDYSFNMWGRPFKLTSEFYYKSMNHINSYAIDNIRIRYRADNITKAYATGLDVRINGEFIPESESWVSIGFLKTEENINSRGYIARPTDQRFKLGILFQDYVPQLPNLKAYLNLVYHSGAPSGVPAYADPYNFQQRLRDYRRADLGILYVFKDANRKAENDNWLKNFKELTAGLELFNMFDIQNAITNTWVRDVATKNQFGVPNFLSARILNFRFSAKF